MHKRLMLSHFLEMAGSNAGLRLDFGRAPVARSAVLHGLRVRLSVANPHPSSCVGRTPGFPLLSFTREIELDYLYAAFVAGNSRISINVPPSLCLA
jgi:hypothetical protein